jgi:hypothetical protein
MTPRALVDTGPLCEYLLVRFWQEHREEWIFSVGFVFKTPRSAWQVPRRDIVPALHGAIATTTGVLTEVDRHISGLNDRVSPARFRQRFWDLAFAEIDRLSMEEVKIALGDLRPGLRRQLGWLGTTDAGLLEVAARRLDVRPPTQLVTDDDSTLARAARPMGIKVAGGRDFASTEW